MSKFLWKLDRRPTGGNPFFDHEGEAPLETIQTGKQRKKTEKRKRPYWEKKK